jgi:hypothetical protein
MGVDNKNTASQLYEQETTMAKLALVAAFLMSLAPAFCLPKQPEPEPTFQPAPQAIYVEPRATKGKY